MPKTAPFAFPWRDLLLLFLLLGGLHALAWTNSEPYFNNDETRHVMTGVFFRDLFHALLHGYPLSGMRQYAVEYYLQYPALGLFMWPPLFYLAEGALMSAAGTSFAAAKLLVLAFAAMSAAYFYFLARRTHGNRTAVLAAALMILAPTIFIFTSHVMLEIPTLAFSLAALYHFQVYLESDRARDVYLAGLAAALAMLTRFEGVYLMPTLLFTAVLAGKWRQLGKPHAWAALLICAALAVPSFIATYRVFGAAQIHAMKSGTVTGATHFMALSNFRYYPAVLPEQLGWGLALSGGAGLAVAIFRAGRAASAPYLALILATYLTFSPMAEQEPRHAIYWIPAFCLFAAAMVTFVLRYRRLMGILAAALCVAGTAAFPANRTPKYIHGYAEAAAFVAENTRDSRYCLFDNYLNGDFIYQLRWLDPDRRVGVLRGDKLFYGVLSGPKGGYQEFSNSPSEILADIYRYDPEFIIVESPQIQLRMPVADLLRRILEDSTARFQFVKEIPIRTNISNYAGTCLRIYKNLLRNPHPETLTRLQMVGMGRPLALPPSAGDRPASNSDSKEKSDEKFGR